MTASEKCSTRMLDESAPNGEKRNIKETYDFEDLLSLETISCLKQGNKYIKIQLPIVVSLSLEEIRILIEAGIFPKPVCHPVYGLSWNSKKINAWSWGLHNSQKLALQVEFYLGYRSDSWAK